MDEKIELSEKDVGCWFLTRDGRPVEIIADQGRSNVTGFPFIGIIGTTEVPESWKNDGRWYYDEEHRNDIVARITKEDADNLIVAQAFKDL